MLLTVYAAETITRVNPIHITMILPETVIGVNPAVPVKWDRA